MDGSGWLAASSDYADLEDWRRDITACLWSSRIDAGAEMAQPGPWRGIRARMTGQGVEIEKGIFICRQLGVRYLFISVSGGILEDERPRQRSGASKMQDARCQS